MTHKLTLDNRALRHLPDITERELPFNKILSELPLAKRTDALNRVTTFSPYDGLNRVTGKSYSDGAPAVSYTYDTTFKGKLASVSSSISTTASHAEQSDDEQPAVPVQLYLQPGGRSGADHLSFRPLSQDVLRHSGPTGFVGGKASKYGLFVEHALLGAWAAKTISVQRWVAPGSTTFTTDLQPVKRTFQKLADSTLLLDLTLGYATPTQNNGNPWSQAINNGARTYNQSYIYDAMNRLKTANEAAVPGGAAWSQTFSYDRYGNRAIVAGSWVPGGGLTPSVSSDDEASVLLVFPNKNQWTDAGHNAVGNVTSLPSRTYQYNAENLLTQATTVGAPATYSYDGEGRRVTKTTGGTTVSRGLGVAVALLLCFACSRKDVVRPVGVPVGAVFVRGAKIGWWQQCTLSNAGQAVHCRIWNGAGLVLEDEEFRSYDGGAPPTAEELKISSDPTFPGPDRIFLINSRVLLPRSRFDELKIFVDWLEGKRSSPR